ncbi:hypothetical protein [Oceanibaculum nanhaiense]|uniref:hypothetical protein n=1 Tax=Oceanibaculum nanhaiense TaxID=1909734 RepID=UPI000A3A0269|nr:hypothetical protein [Oceanibaculum nanhaiense]
MPNDISGLRSAEEAVPAAGDRATHFIFAHKIFASLDGYFGLSHEHREPVFFVSFGEMNAALPFATLRREFGIDPESDDGRLLDVVAQGLRYVKEIRPGDSIPRELLDGSASWTVEEVHRRRSTQRIRIQVASYGDGEEMLIFDMAEMARLTSTADFEGRYLNGCRKLAGKLGLKRDSDGKTVQRRIDALAREIIYIEALRDRFNKIRAVQRGLAELRRAYSRDPVIRPDIDRALALIRAPMDDFEGVFTNLYAQVSEILLVLMAHGPYIAFIRDSRDELHNGMMRWDGLVTEWENLIPQASQTNENLVKSVYRFLATNYPQAGDWTLVGKLEAQKELRFGNAALAG